MKELRKRFNMMITFPKSNKNLHKEDVTDKILSTTVGGGGDRERERERPTCISILFKLMSSSLGSSTFFPPSATTLLQYLFHTYRFL
jgi:hypothetical protein